jgi:putative transposase
VQRDKPFHNGEIYHIYNRGAHKQKIFTNNIDYSRFQLLLHLGNTRKSVHISNLLTHYKGKTFIKVYEDIQIPDEEMLVDVLAYTLMPNHFHLILHQAKENGISTFLQKISTAYSMYFNKKYKHSGTLFQGAFKSRHVGTGDYLRWLFAYVYLNPFEMVSGLKKHTSKSTNPQHKVTSLITYPYSSLFDLHIKQPRPEAKIIAFKKLKELKDDHHFNMNELREIIKARPL